MFVIAEFEEDQVAIVRDSWLTPLKKEVFWPPYKQRSLYNKALLEGEESKDTWPTFQIKRIFYETDDYEKAKKKLKLVEDTSDLASESEEKIKSRPTKKPKRYMSATSESEGENEKLPRPPKILKNKEQVTRVAQPSLPESNLRDKSKYSTLILNRSKAETERNVSEEQHFQNPYAHQSTVNPSETEFRKQIFQVLYQIKEQNAHILKVISGNLNKENVGIPADFPIQLPISNLEELQKVEAYLSNSENFSVLVAYLSTIGGKDITAKTNRVFKLVMSDDVAKNFNFFGKRADKQAFSDLKLKSALIGAVKKSAPESNEKQIEDIIKIWLKHAPQRLDRKNKNKNLNRTI